MAEIKISQLEQAQSITNNDILPIVNEGETKSVTVGALSEQVATNLEPVSYNADGLMTVADKHKLDEINMTEIEESIDELEQQHATDIATINGNITALTARVTKNEKTITYNAKRLDNLVKLTQGKVFDYQTDVTESYTKSIPSGSQEYGALNMVGGKSLVYNQLLKNEKASKTVSGVTITNNGDGSFTLNGTATATTRYELQESGFATILTHKYYISSHNSKMSSTWGYMIFTHLGSLRNAEYERVNAGTIVDVADALAFRVMNGTTYNNDIIKPICIDLTQMFGAGNEPTLEQCREIFSADYYPYNVGELMNFGVNAVETVGDNHIDLSKFVDLVPSTAYVEYKNDTLFVKQPTSPIYATGIKCHANAGDVISYELMTGTGKSIRFRGNGAMITTPTTSENVWTTVTATLANDIDILQLDWSTNGDFKIRNFTVNGKPYRKETYTIPQNVLNLADYGASAGSVYNYIDFDRKVYVQNVKSVDLGTLTWTTRKTGSVNVGYSTSLPYNYVSINASSARLNWTTSSTYNGGTTAANISTDVDTMPVGVYHYNTGSSTGTIYFIAPVGSTQSGKLNYKLATPIETDISQYIDNGLIFAEGNGTITFKNVHGNDYRVAVPNKETYMLKLSDAI